MENYNSGYPTEKVKNFDEDRLARIQKHNNNHDIPNFDHDKILNGEWFPVSWFFVNSTPSNLLKFFKYDLKKYRVVFRHDVPGRRLFSACVIEKDEPLILPTTMHSSNSCINELLLGKWVYCFQNGVVGATRHVRNLVTECGLDPKRYEAVIWNKELSCNGLIYTEYEARILNKR